MIAGTDAMGLLEPNHASALLIAADGDIHITPDWHHAVHLTLKSSICYSIYAAFSAMFLTGASWLVADWQKNMSNDEIWQQTAAYLLMAHGGAAMVTLLLLGALIPVHVLRSWRSCNNLVTGSVMITLNALLVVTAFGLYYLGSETVRPRMSWIHFCHSNYGG